ncbi:conserved hypothetical protein [Trichinella spiralis]|uniref:hypothetical protein n=1 Tax=Trichinella spiralis TaxID=6334 RepID=UPI0001EFB944|nr:conserved hypothetical protein [Trichinella spiralis]
MYTEVVYEFCGKASPHLFESLILLEESEHSGIYNRLAMATIVLCRRYNNCLAKMISAKVNKSFGSACGLCCKVKTTIIVNCRNCVCKTELVALENCKKFVCSSSSLRGQNNMNVQIWLEILPVYEQWKRVDVFSFCIIITHLCFAQKFIAWLRLAIGVNCVHSARLISFKQRSIGQSALLNIPTNQKCPNASVDQ